MNNKLFLSLLLAGAATASQADEARLLRFPATNGQEHFGIPIVLACKGNGLTVRRETGKHFITDV